MNLLPLALRMLWRDLRAGELHLLGLALVIAVASLTSVGFFTDRVNQTVSREANQLLGGDLLLAADHPWRPAFAEEARRRGLRVLTATQFTSMVSTGEQAQLAGVKAVEPGYPLRGQVRIASGLNQPDRAADAIPAPGEAWLDERLTAALGVRPGDQVGLGNTRLRVAGVLTYESDRGANFFSIVPRLMMNAADLPATGLIQQGSRVRYRLQVAGEEAAVAAFRDWAQPRLERGERLEDIQNSRPEVRNVMDRARTFLRLAALLAVILAAVAIGLGARRFMQRHLDGCAVMRCLGARQGRVLGLFLVEFLLFGLAATLAGCALGYVVQLGLEWMLGSFFTGGLPAPSAWPAVHGLVVGLVLLLGFVVPQLLRLGRVPTVRVLRREWAGTETAAGAGWGAGAAALLALMFWIAGEAKLGLWVAGGFAAAMAVFALVGWLGLRTLGRVRHAAGAGWRYGLASLRRRQGSSLVQAVALSVGLTALLLLTLTRGDLVQTWRGTVPPDAPNRFIINVQPDQVEPLQAFFRGEGIAPPALLPMVRGRLVAVNGEPVAADHYADGRARRLVEREFNLSYGSGLPPGNVVAGGRWHGNAGAPQFSVEQGLAETLGLALGDRLDFEVAGQRVGAEVTSLRKLEWDSMRVNFFVIASPGLLEDQPASYITSFHLPPDKAGATNRMVARFPNLTVIDMAAILRQFQTVTDQLSRAVQFVFGFAVLAGIAVLLAALQSTHDEREYEMAILRTLGARNRQLSAALLAEFAALGALAGALGGIAASGIGYALGRFVFRLEYLPDPLPVAVGALLGAAGVTLVGLLSTRGILRRPAIASLRQLA